MKILICEDNAVIAMDLGFMLMDLGHTICGTATNSVECMEKVALTRPDLVMVDLNLGDGLTGIGLVEALAQLGLPSVIVSGETQALITRTSAKAVLSKPFDEERLAQALAAVGADQEPRPPKRPAIEPAEAGLTSEAGVLQGVDVVKPRRPWFSWLWRQGA